MGAISETSEVKLRPSDPEYSSLAVRVVFKDIHVKGVIACRR